MLSTTGASAAHFEAITVVVVGTSSWVTRVRTILDTRCARQQQKFTNSVLH